MKCNESEFSTYSKEMRANSEGTYRGGIFPGKRRRGGGGGCFQGHVLSHIILTVALLKVSGPIIETSCVFQCIKNKINAEMWA